MELTIERIIILMNEYQKRNNITRSCVTNTQLLYDLIKANISTSKAKATAVVSHHIDEDNDGNHFTTHLVLMENEDVYDASYEISNKPNVLYFRTLKDLFGEFKSMESTIKQKIILEFIKMVYAAEMINNGKFATNDLDVYNKQLDFIDESLVSLGFVGSNIVIERQENIPNHLYLSTKTE